MFNECTPKVVDELSKQKLINIVKVMVNNRLRLILTVAYLIQSNKHPSMLRLLKSIDKNPSFYKKIAQSI